MFATIIFMENPINRQRFAVITFYIAKKWSDIVVNFMGKGCFLLCDG